jgi:hemerythrin-like domain-containing protein
MDSHEVSSWMIEENAKVHVLSGELRAKVTQRPRGDRAEWIADLQRRLDEFARHLNGHRSMEEDGGYLSQVVELRPTLAGAVEVIHHEHDELEEILTDLHAAVRELRETDILFLRDCCRRVQHFLDWLERHEEHENHIVMFAFTEDLGVGG